VLVLDLLTWRIFSCLALKPLGSGLLPARVDTPRLAVRYL